MSLTLVWIPFSWASDLSLNSSCKPSDSTMNAAFCAGQATSLLNTVVGSGSLSPCGFLDPSLDMPASYLSALPFSQNSVDGKQASCGLKTSSTDSGFSYCSNDVADYEFTLSNHGSPRINPAGGSVRREYTFSAPERGKQDTGLLVYEWGTNDPAAPDSAWSMMSEIVFFPRMNIPAIKPLTTADGRDAYQVTLQTGESVVFDRKTKEIISGALQESAPIDMNSNRQARSFAALRYTGNGIMVRSDQRGESPRSAVVWGQKKTVTVTWGDKTCKKLTPADLWQQTNPDDGGGAGLYVSDDDFYKVLSLKCGWNVSSTHLGSH